MITLPAKERYMQFIKEKPSAIKHAPLKHIATYLGITDTSLSRIRKEVC
jgi:cyclic nucleotide-binding protein